MITKLSQACSCTDTTIFSCTSHHKLSDHMRHFNRLFSTDQAAMLDASATQILETLSHSDHVSICEESDLRTVDPHIIIGLHFSLRNSLTLTASMRILSRDSPLQENSQSLLHSSPSVFTLRQNFVHRKRHIRCPASRIMPRSLARFSLESVNSSPASQFGRVM